MHQGMADEMIRMAVEQFLPSVAAGMLMTFVLVRYVPSAEWMLPGVWQVIFSLGVFSSCRFLPRPMIAAGVWYLATGAFCISLAMRGRCRRGRWAFPMDWGNCWWRECSTTKRRRRVMKVKARRSEGRFAYEGLAV